MNGFVISRISQRRSQASQSWSICCGFINEGSATSLLTNA